jgi:hypothetical protein
MDEGQDHTRSCPFYIHQSSQKSMEEFLRMANNNQAQGFACVGQPLRVSKYIAAGAVYPGDTVTLNSSGQAAASATVPLLGVAMSYASAQGAEVLVADHPDQKFVCQANGTAPAAADVGQNYSVLATSPNTTYKCSRMELDASTAGTTSTLALKLLDKDRRDDNDWGTYVDVIVKINNHVLGGGAGAAGI